MSGEMNVEDHFPRSDRDLPEAYLQHARLTIAEITGDVAATRELIEILDLMPAPPLDAPPTSIPEIEPEELDLEDVLTVEEPSLPCEGCGKPAVWILWRLRCCDESPAFVLACDRCRINQLSYPSATWCAGCDHKFLTMTDAFPTVEPLGGPLGGSR